ncbi:MAG: DMT family transporter, partial [Actinomycetota bacterium]|nr:DMT family transporter [Actinomycetota bacterium]
SGTRFAGALLAVAALGLSSVGAPHGQVRPLLFAVIALTGAGLALQQAVNGQLQRVLGEARLAGLASFLVGTAVLAAVVVGLSVAGRLSSLHWPPPSYLWLGGLGGACFIIVTAAVVRTVGVLRISLAAVAGQLLGAVLLDALVPAPGHRLTLMTVLATAVTFAAVAVAGSGRRWRS